MKQPQAILNYTKESYTRYAMSRGSRANILANAPTVTPATADTINSLIVKGIDGVQALSPSVAAASVVAASVAMAYDRLTTKGILTKRAVRESFPTPKRAGRLRTAVSYIALTAAATAPTAAVAGGAAFVLGTERSVRQGQLGAIDTMYEQAGIDDADILVTQGGVDTPMATSYVPKNVATEIIKDKTKDGASGAGFYSFLPKVTNQSDRGQEMDGLVLSVPSLKPGTVIASGLTGLKKGDTAVVNGKEHKVTEDPQRKLASMQRETLLVSNDVAEQITGYEDGEGNYFGVYIPHENADQEKLQRELDEQYGAGNYTAITAEEFREGVEKFMGKNGSPILLLAAIAMVAAGIVTESAAAYKKTTQNMKTLGIMQAIGGSKYQNGMPEVLGAYFRLLSAVPTSALVGVSVAMGANSINLGLSSTVGVKELIGALVVVGGPSMAAATVAARKATQIPAVQAMRA